MDKMQCWELRLKNCGHFEKQPVRVIVVFIVWDVFGQSVTKYLTGRKHTTKLGQLE
jgi:hypothetical protein